MMMGTEYALSVCIANAGIAALALPFNPVRLVLLVVWIYLCLFFVQRVQFSLLVPKRFKLIASLASLVAGPVLFVALMLIDGVKKSLAGQQDIFDIITDQLRNISSGITLPGFLKPNDSPQIRLLDTAGRNLKDIYGHGKGKREDNKMLRFTEHIILNALEERASDILIDPKDNSTYSVRLRIDGMLRNVEALDTETCGAVINSIKAVSNMDISEKRRPQDGAFVAKTADVTASFRVASAGVLNGEKLSIRVLNQDAGRFRLDNIGLTEKQRAVIVEMIEKPSGMILMCGPTGSGKTTTLYAMLNNIDLLTRNVITVEDPIEYVLEHASQIEVNPKADITFAKSLRSILRQDPDVICVGEVRDEETAGIALRAAQTGHLVFATIHSDSNASALIRLIDLGVSPMLLASGINLLVSQRLLRLLCENCKAPAKLTASQIHDFKRNKINYTRIYEAQGCEDCGGTGYKGRTAVFDVLVLDNNLKSGIAHNPTLITELKKDGDRRGKSNLQKQGLRAVVTGRTTLEELKRVIG